MAPPTLQHRLEYLLLRGIEEALAPLSPRTVARLGGALGGWIHAPLGIRRRVVVENLRRAFPEAEDAWIDEVARESYRHLGREVMAMLRLAKLDRSGVEASIEIEAAQWRAVEAAWREGRGVLLATGHYGNWEMAAALVAARGLPIEAIVKRQSNPLVDAHIERGRRALGVEPVEMGRAARAIPRALRAGRAIGIVADQSSRHSSVWVPFFGIPARSHRGPAYFALRYDAPLFAASARRLPDGRYRLSAERIEVRRTGTLEEDLVRITATLARHLEEEIRIDPTQYFWFHQRWKGTPPEEPPSALPGTSSNETRGGDAG